MIEKNERRRYASDLSDSQCAAAIFTGRQSEQMEKRELADAGRSAGPSCAIIDSQSVKTTSAAEERGIDGEKNKKCGAGPARTINYLRTRRRKSDEILLALSAGTPVEPAASGPWRAFRHSFSPPPPRRSNSRPGPGRRPRSSAGSPGRAGRTGRGPRRQKSPWCGWGRGPCGSRGWRCRDR